MQLTGHLREADQEIVVAAFFQYLDPGRGVHFIDIVVYVSVAIE